MKGCGSAKRNHRVLAGFFAPLDGMNASRIRHIFFHHLNHTCRRPVLIKSQRLTNSHSQCGASSLFIKLQPATCKAMAVESAQNQICVRHRGFFATHPVRHGSRLRPGAVRTHTDAPQRINSSDGPTARTDLDHVDNGNSDRQPTAFHIAVLTGHFKRCTAVRLAVLNQTDLCSGAPHIERQYIVEFSG